MRIEDKIIFNEIKQGNKEVYKALFDDYYEHLVSFAKSFLFDQQESENLVQDLFVHLYEHATKVKIETSVKAYFYQAVRNRCLNYIKSLKVRDKNHLMYMDGVLQTDDELEYFDPQILVDIKESINELPEQMGKIFTMKMIDGESRDIIAQELGISVNTVKTQLQRAKSKLREKLLNKTNLLFLL